MKHVFDKISFILALSTFTSPIIHYVDQQTLDAEELISSSHSEIAQESIAESPMAGHPGSHKSNRVIASSENDRIPVKMVAPFDLAGRLIVVEAEIEGVRGNFIVDSGSPSFVLNVKRFPWLMDHAQTLGHALHGAGGAIEEIKSVKASGFKWQKAELNSVKALFSDLSHLEENIGTDIVGLIGADFLRNFTIQFDYARKELTLFSENTVDSWQTSPNQAIDFSMIGHIPVIDARIGNHSLRLGIDCGAERGMLFTKWEDPLKPHYEFLRNDILIGGDTNSQMGNVVRLYRFEIGNLQYDEHTFRFNNISSGHDMKIDGILGYEFLSQYKTAIDYQNRKLYVWDAE
jgi:hypothetical protein